ncbi:MULTISPECIES: nitrite reductase large subunit NirB [unclassified Mycolicibacterium]|uniref:nitrite reductase large subunit NirB n=1 Tax=unclassified Mycolicibacterium TaxID=2636767 RepID=UPI0012DE454E|nr:MULTISPECIES: nitrite reductase large subunit NirB [unclassified Mycolicibacterium]MUL82592.1 nitrite reductase large subunit [Mycolicibacterium sp. CBMA 329]MUL88927.1 nitrite reductase large subunit [Mycolicibacterium sp. CBMA 331]MUL97495.1 nitrite reductase large subunit [Mycolicibacterium sp. CBMA 334]MUM26780.1 nitrite reductase large subunit [Mycolicibacterium sp. CBMA 295]MUM38443.1 nitrite reductase large subunit [Mycolicibacterium sp. CBMA 247]
MSSTQNVVVVGHGMVGHRFVEALRSRDAAGAWRVTVLAEEADAAYDRVGLTGYTEHWDRARLALPGNDYAGDGQVDLRLGCAVAEIDRAAKTVRTIDGQTIDYDALVLATGSYAFVPPVPGHDLPGCHVYRTLDDLDEIRAAALRSAESGLHGVVIGGGLLGLEAANALRQFGVHAHIVERAPHLMSQQLDEAGGALLVRMISGLGIGVHTNIGTDAIEVIDNGLRVCLSDGSLIDAGVVIFAAGVRPRDELARAAGLDLAERGGVLTDLSCITSDLDVYAVGEVAAIQGRCYGLVGPGYTSAEVVADRLLGGRAEFPEADMSTKLKLLGVDVASFGDAMGTTPDCLQIVVNDAVNQTYAKLVLSDDAKTLLGGILVGDATSYGVLRPMVGEQLPGDPMALIAPAGSENGASGLGVGALPDAAQICSCNNVTKGDLTEAIGGGCCDVAQLKKCTLAGTSCGSCVPLLKQLLEVEGVEQSKALCEHFQQSRAEMFEIISATEIRTFSGLIERFGTGKGCDICKPAIASILASTSSDHILAGEQASLQDSNDHFLANIQKNGSYSVVPRVPGGDITPEQLILIGEIARDFDLYTKITGGQRIDMFGARVEQLPEIWRRLVEGGMESGHAYGKSLRTVKSCVGSDWCRYGQQDSVQMAINLELRYRGLRAPHKIKMGVSGCARECAEARAKDVGVIATETGWNLYICGNGGMTPKHAQLLAGDLDDETLIRYIDRFLMFYIRTADRLQRTAPWLEALDGGLDHLRDVVCNDSLGLAEEFEAAVARHVDGYSCEWKGVLESPEKLARFVSFVNAPDVDDPTITFTEHSGRKVPGATHIGMPKVRGFQEAK